MRSTRGSAWALLLAILLVLGSGCAHKPSYSVVSVADGDTITVVRDKVSRKIRLAGIDAPEKNQPFGMMAREFLPSLVFGKDVEIETEKMDRYGREVGKVLLNGRDMNLAMVVAGLAWHYKKYQAEQSSDDRRLYDSAEKDARSAGRGLWVDPVPIPPSEWRAGKRRPSTADLPSAVLLAPSAH